MRDHDLKTDNISLIPFINTVGGLLRGFQAKQKTFYLARLAEYQITKSYGKHEPYVAELIAQVVIDISSGRGPELLETEGRRRDHDQQLSEESWAWIGADTFREYWRSEECVSSFKRLASGGASNDAAMRMTRQMQLMVLCNRIQLTVISKSSGQKSFVLKLPNGPNLEGILGQVHLEFSSQDSETKKELTRIAEFSDEKDFALVDQATYASDTRSLMARKRTKNGCLSDFQPPPLCDSD